MDDINMSFGAVTLYTLYENRIVIHFAQCTKKHTIHPTHHLVLVYLI